MIQLYWLEFQGGGGGDIVAIEAKYHIECLVKYKQTGHSIKESTREKRGKGIRQKVGEGVNISFNFQDFLKNPKNKGSFSTC